MRIDEFFDPYNLDHLKAYKHMKTKGKWPKNFIPDYVEFSPGWTILLWGKMADEWVKKMLKEVK